MSSCEIFRFYKLITTKSLIEPVSMIVPRRVRAVGATSEGGRNPSWRSRSRSRGLAPGAHAPGEPPEAGGPSSEGRLSRCAPPPTAILELLHEWGHGPLLWASVSSTHRVGGESAPQAL